ncbi:FixH family protein [Pedobacter arcticus]|uniref:FixH family protein n=1 Tax=Pedobacter arcticus TaxID=752140 RepID=UPI0002F5110B|nr:FixH family protein [Pedobacter arcticus]
MKNLTKYLVIAIIPFLFTSCEKSEESPNPTINKIKVGEAMITDANTKLQIWADADLNTGYNKLYLIALDATTNEPKSDATFAIKPMMTMTMTGGMTMTHSSPFEQADAAAKKNNLTPAAAVFTMPTSDSGFWKMEVTLNNNKKAIIPIKVEESKQSRLIMASTADKTNYIVALLPNPAYKIGANDFELQISRKIDANTYTPVNDFTVEMTPEMPDMGHGSPNNVNPTFVANGHYKGKVNFTMSGYWKVNLKIKDASGTTIGEDTFFKITF